MARAWKDDVVGTSRPPGFYDSAQRAPRMQKRGPLTSKLANYPLRWPLQMEGIQGPFLSLKGFLFLFSF